MASKALLKAAQQIMDSYYQDFKPDEAFFDLEDFAAWIGVCHGKIADDVAAMIYKATLMEEGMGMITFAQDWWAEKDLVLAKNVLDISGIKAMGFTYDQQESGIQEVQPTEGDSDFIRTTLTEKWQLNGMGKNNIIYWWKEPGKLKFKSGCNIPPKITVYYIPTADDENFKLPKSKEFEIATMAWNFMVAAKQGTPFVDATNNSNKNVIPQTETDTKQIKPVGT